MPEYAATSATAPTGAPDGLSDQMPEREGAGNRRRTIEPGEDARVARGSIGCAHSIVGSVHTFFKITFAAPTFADDSTPTLGDQQLTQRLSRD